MDPSAMAQMISSLGSGSLSPMSYYSPPLSQPQPMSRLVKGADQQRANDKVASQPQTNNFSRVMAILNQDERPLQGAHRETAATDQSTDREEELINVDSFNEEEDDARQTHDGTGQAVSVAISREAPRQSIISTAKKIRPKNFLCKKCPMAFSNNGQLKNHTRIHTGERPFACDRCDKDFTRNEELTRHKLIHSGLRPHTCSRCLKSFGRKDHLKKHEKTHDRRLPRNRLRTPGALQRRVPANPRAEVQPIPSPSKESTMGHGVRLNHKTIATENTVNPRFNGGASSAHIFPNSVQYGQFYNDAYVDLIAGVPLVPPVTFAQSTMPPFSNHTAPRALSAFAPKSITGTDILQQRLATDYWQHWHQLLGFYQQQQQLFQQQHLNN